MRSQMLLAYRENPSFFAVGRRLGVHHQTVQRCVERASSCNRDGNRKSISPDRACGGPGVRGRQPRSALVNPALLDHPGAMAQFDQAFRVDARATDRLQEQAAGSWRALEPRPCRWIARPERKLLDHRFGTGTAIRVDLLPGGTSVGHSSLVNSLSA
jgi:hypothetical protein